MSLKNNENIDLLDILGVISFGLGVLNYSENLTQTDKGDLMLALDKQTETLLSNMDDRLERIESILKEVLNEKNQRDSPKNPEGIEVN